MSEIKNVGLDKAQRPGLPAPEKFKFWGLVLVVAIIKSMVEW